MKKFILNLNFYFYLLLFLLPNLISSQNVFSGTGTGTGSTGSLNVGFGYRNIRNISGTNNVALGSYALSSGINASPTISNLGIRNVAIGNYVLTSNTSGDSNIAIGYENLFNNNDGDINVAIGYRCLFNNTTGGSNIALGDNALFSNENGEHNVVLGAGSGVSNLSGSNNVFLGVRSGRYSLGSSNVLIGENAGHNLVGGNNNIILGNNFGIQNGSNNVFIGQGISSPNISNTVIVTVNSNERFRITDQGLMGLGTSTPQNKLEIKSGQNNNAGLRFTNLNSSFNPTTTASKFLTVNNNGDVILSNILATNGGENIYNSDGGLETDRRVDFRNNNLWFDTSESFENGRIYIGNNPDYQTQTGDYRLYVEGGIMTEKIRVAIPGSANWADYVFDKEYRLMSLKDLEKFIKSNKHLPGIKSADELVKEGLDIAEITAKQMEKIEELTLYTINQQKELDLQKLRLETQAEEIEILKKQVKLLLKKNNSF